MQDFPMQLKLDPRTSGNGISISLTPPFSGEQLPRTEEDCRPHQREHTTSARWSRPSCAASSDSIGRCTASLKTTPTRSIAGVLVVPRIRPSTLDTVGPQFEPQALREYL